MTKPDKKGGTKDSGSANPPAVGGLPEDEFMDYSAKVRWSVVQCCVFGRVYSDAYCVLHAMLAR